MTYPRIIIGFVLMVIGNMILSNYWEFIEIFGMGIFALGAGYVANGFDHD